MLARSVDGGETWTLEDPGAQGYLLTEGGYLHGVTRPGVTLPELRDSSGGIDFTHPDLAPHRPDQQHPCGHWADLSLLRSRTDMGRPLPPAQLRHPRHRAQNGLHRRQQGSMHALHHSRKVQWQRRPYAVRAHDGWRGHLEPAGMDRTGTRRGVFDHALLGEAFRYRHPCNCPHAGRNRALDRDLPVHG